MKIENQGTIPEYSSQHKEQKIEQPLNEVPKKLEEKITRREALDKIKKIGIAAFAASYFGFGIETPEAEAQETEQLSPYSTRNLETSN